MVLLSGGALIAVATPAYVAYAAPDLAGYLLHPAIFLIQLLPYMVCAGLWLPRRTPAAATTAVIMSASLLLAAVAMYGPMVWAPESRGGDMIALAFVAISLGTTVAVLAGSALAALVLRLRRDAGPRQNSTPGDRRC